MTETKRRLSPLAVVLILSGVFFSVFLAISGGLFLYKSSKSIHGSSAGNSIFSSGSVGVIEVSGVILDSKKTLQKLEQLAEDSDIKAVVLRLNSPGGSVAPSQEIYEAVKNFKKPIVASMASVAASGAYYIACGAKKVFANPGTITGSIGVIMEFANLQKLYDWAKIHRYVLKTGKFKDAGAEYREMDSEERALLQGMIDDVLVQFKEAVSAGRKLPMEKVSAIADGRIFSGNQAKAAQLVDELGTFDDAVKDAAKMGNIKGKPNVVYIDKSKRRFLDLLLDDSSSNDSSSRTGSIKLRLLSQILSLLDSKSEISDSKSLYDPGIYWIWKGARTLGD